MVNSHPITNLEELQQRIQQEISKITETDIRNVLRNFRKRIKSAWTAMENRSNTCCNVSTPEHLLRE